MTTCIDCAPQEMLNEGIVLKQIDHLCLVHVPGRSMDAWQTRDLGQKLLAFMERTGCRKLVMTFDGVESISSFFVDQFHASRPAIASRPEPAVSDLWVG